MYSLSPVFIDELKCLRYQPIPPGRKPVHDANSRDGVPSTDQSCGRVSVRHPLSLYAESL